MPAAREFRGAHTLALAVCAATAMLLLWPLLTGQILFGGARSDMFIAGYSFRLFGARTLLETGAIPQWNPYLFGGLPYVGAMHGDIFYPTAWLRWIMPVDLAITWGMVLHFVLAGWFMYRFTRALGLTWGAAIFSGVSYELTGIVASQMSPGHDGKLFVSALTPLAFWVLLHAIRRGKQWAFGVFAIVVALIVLGHYHMAYFLLIALGLWALYLAILDPDRPQHVPAWKALALAAAAVAVGVGITALQVLPFLAYIPFSPRAAGGPDQGWAFASGYAFPPSEIFTLLLPQFNGVLEHYWGHNAIKFHTEYLGFLPFALALLSLGDRPRRSLVRAFAATAILFLMFSFASYTPLYRPFFELLPGLNKIRAMGMVFYLVAFSLCVLAGIGMDRVLAKAVRPRNVLVVVGGIGLFAALGALGGLQALAESIAIPERADAVVANAPFLRAGGLRLLVFVALGGGVLWATAAGRLAGGAATAALVTLVAVDLWSVDRSFYVFSPRASVLFADDAVTSHLRQVRPPYRVLDAGESYGHSILMAYRIPVVTGYHGFQLQRFNDLGGYQQGWQNLLSPSLLDLLAIRFVVAPRVQEVPDYHQVVGPTSTAFGTTAVLYERNVVPAYARVLPAAVKAPENQIVPTLVDPRYPVNGVALLPDTSTSTAPSAQPPFRRSTVSATVTDWRPGAMTVALQGTEPGVSQLLVSENWYPDWRAEVDGKPGVVRRLDYTLLGVDVPAGTRQIRLTFDSPAYARGKILTALSLMLAALMIVLPLIRQSRAAHRRSRLASTA